MAIIAIDRLKRYSLYNRSKTRAFTKELNLTIILKNSQTMDQNEKLWGDAIRNIFGVLNFRDGRFIQETFKNIITSNYI